MHSEKRVAIGGSILPLHPKREINAMSCNDFLWVAIKLRKTLRGGTKETLAEEAEEKDSGLHFIMRVPEVDRRATQEPEPKSQRIPHGGHVNKDAVVTKSHDASPKIPDLRNFGDPSLFPHRMHAASGFLVREALLEAQRRHAVTLFLECANPVQCEVILAVEFLRDEEKFHDARA